MKRVYVCGSFRFIDKIEEIESKLRREGIQCMASKFIDSRGILGCLEKIDNADVVYIVNPNGYIGKSVCIDVGYAYARKKPIYIMHHIEDPPIMNIVNGILSIEEFMVLIKRSNFI
jgi:nucleoside 2-deoxyribosyltransferase